MSFYTSLTGLNAATAMLGVTANNISNVGTTGFKRSRADFGDIFATSPLQKSSSTVGQGVSLKQVSQEFGQGNISFSSNALDLAVTGDGFFPMRSADGLTQVYTRNGSFLLNEQFNVVNSAGQRLMAATVDSTGSANINERVVLTIPQKTSGEAKQTSSVSLGLNFPADASVITTEFNRTNPATYNKSTAFTVYDNGGNGYLATIYYVKTQNANQLSPFNKWQTYVYVGDDKVNAALVQAADKNNSKLYVNQYGQIKPYSEVKDELIVSKTQMFSLDELTDKRNSVPAAAAGVAVTSPAYLTGMTEGLNFKTLANDRTPVGSAASTGVTKVDVKGVAATTTTSGTTAKSIVTFSSDLKAGESVTVSGLTYTSTGATTKEQLARAFGGIDQYGFDGKTRYDTVNSANFPGTFSGSFTGFVSTPVGGSPTQPIESAPVTFDTDLTAGQSFTLGGLTFTSTGATTAAELADAFSGLTVAAVPAATGVTTKGVLVAYSAKGTFTGKLAGVTTGTVTAATTVNGVTTPAQLATNLVLPATSASTFTFPTTNLAAGQTYSFYGLTYTALGTTTPAQLATAFAGLANGATTGAAAATGLAGTSAVGTGTWSGKLTGISTTTVDGTLTSKLNTITASNSIALTSVSVSKLVEPPPITATNLGMQFRAGLKDMFQIDVDGSGNPISVDLSHLANMSTPITGNAIAAEVTNYLNRRFGDENNFDFSATSSKLFTITDSAFTTADAAGGDPKVNDYKIDMTTALAALTNSDGSAASADKVSVEQAVLAMQASIDAAANGTLKYVPPKTSAITGITTPATGIKVSYDYSTQGFKFVDGINTITLKAPGDPTLAVPVGKNDLLGLSESITSLDESGGYATKVIPNAVKPIRSPSEQRYGMAMTFDSVNKVFSLQSGSTGDKSSIVVTKVNDLATNLLGLKAATIDKSNTALRGITSLPAVAVGTAPTINITNNFIVDKTNNTFIVTVDGVKGTVVVPPRTDYSIDTFMAQLQKGINAMGSSTANGGTPGLVNGVKVSYDYSKNRFQFTSGTTGSNSFIKISGASTWGLDQVEAGRGGTSTWIKPTQHSDVIGGVAAQKFIDGDGKETTSGDGFSTLPPWSPLYLDKGELTFDTGGKLVSPMQGTQLETVFLAGGKGALTVNIKYGASTQYSSPFAVLSQSQDGAPEGDLVGVTIGNDGLVSASFSNGNQKSLAKILLANFSSPVGLRQIGDSSFLASAASGNAILGTAGSAGFGTLRAGATERANVDLTQELVDLITAQRNFQANAKAIETSTTMTSAIINLRS